MSYICLIFASILLFLGLSECGVCTSACVNFALALLNFGAAFLLVHE